MALPNRGGDPCLDCHRDFFHFDGGYPLGSCEFIMMPPQWDCQQDDHHESSTHCTVDEACCDEDACSVDCTSICDGFVDCDAATACSDLHCDDTNCEDTSLACCDTHCWGYSPHDLESLLRLPGLNPSAQNSFLPTKPSVEEAASAPTLCRGHGHISGIGGMSELSAQSSILGLAGAQSDPHMFSCFAFAKDLHGSLTGSSSQKQLDAQHAESLQSQGACVHIPSCDAWQNTGQEFGSSDALPFSCPHKSHDQVSGDVDQTSTTTNNPHRPRGVCRAHHRSRTQLNLHAHPYSPSARASVSSAVSNKVSSPAETRSVVNGISFNAPIPPDTPSKEKVAQHVCKWIKRLKGVETPCGATFPDSGSLQDHLISDHSVTVTGPQGDGFYCRWEGCPRRDEPFSQKSKLQGHFLTHSNRASDSGPPTFPDRRC